MQALVKSSGDILFGAVLLVHLVSSPYAKVEESFNLHAVHDILERKHFYITGRVLVLDISTVPALIERFWFVFICLFKLLLVLRRRLGLRGATGLSS